MFIDFLTIHCDIQSNTSCSAWEKIDTTNPSIWDIEDNTVMNHLMWSCMKYT